MDPNPKAVDSVAWAGGGWRGAGAGGVRLANLAAKSEIHPGPSHCFLDSTKGIWEWLGVGGGCWEFANVYDH